MILFIAQYTISLSFLNFLSLKCFCGSFYKIVLKISADLEFNKYLHEVGCRLSATTYDLFKEPASVSKLAKLTMPKKNNLD